MTKFQDNTPATILIVDDQRMVRDVVRMTLEQAGFCVLAADSGAQAIHLEGITPGTIDLLLSDVMMPGMTGPVLAQLLRKHRPEMGVMLMSGHIDTDVSLWKNDWTFLQKPFSPVELIAKVNQALDTRQLVPCNYEMQTQVKTSGATA